MLNKIKFRNAVLILFTVLSLAISCKKDPKASSTGPLTTTTTVVTGSRVELTKDSIYLYSRETYYWNDQMPSYEIFKPRNYASNLALLDAIRALPGTGKPLIPSASDNVPREKYSFLDDGSLAAELGGVSGDFGFSVFYNNSEDLRIKYVSPGSPAASSGLKRGYKIIKLNNRTDLSSTVNANLNFVSNAVFGSGSSVSLTVVKPDDSEQSLTITRGTYSNNPIFLSKIFERGGKKIGYIVYNSFTTNSKDALTTVITDLYSKGATELIVDLRYNGGGSVSTADVLINLISPISIVPNQQVMYTTFWTKTMQDGNAKILAHQPLLDANGKLQPFTGGVNGKYATYADINYKPTADAGNVELFEKKGTADFKKIYFLVLKGTASASELVINSLKGVMSSSDIKLIGQQTYGKPVGFFGIAIDNLDLYVPQFETKNQKNEGGYYNGMAVDYPVNDDVTKDFGDPSEKLLAAALNYSEKGTFAVSNIPNTISSISGMSVSETIRLNEVLDKTVFKGMLLDKPMRLKKKE